MKRQNSSLSRIIISLLLAVLTVGLAGAAVATDSLPIFSGENSSQNMAPIAENKSLCTFRGVSVSGEFSAVDPEGDAVMFTVASPPKKGTVILGDDGRTFTYQPAAGKKGKDSFTYTATDAANNTSAEAKVELEILKQSTKTAYADMADNSAYYAALALAENGVFIGERLGDESFFRPDATVTRGEFLAMSLKTCGIKNLEDITKTGFYDDDRIPVWTKPYVSTALMSGLITGYKNADGRLVFSSESPITYSEAAVILNKLLGIPDVVSVAAMEVEAAPAWAYTAAVNLTACDILPTGIGDMYNDSLTRAEAAKMLLASAELLEARGSSDRSLLGWAK